MGSNCSCINDSIVNENESKLTQFSYKKVSSAESTLNSVIKIQSLWRGYYSRKKVSVFKLPDLLTPIAKQRESKIPEYKFPVLGWRGKPRHFLTCNSKDEFYIGEFEKNLKHGQGVLVLITGEKFQGYFKYDKKHGHGRCIYSNGDVYEGEWNLGLRSGNGNLHCINGFKYSGQWVNDKYHGKGQESWPDGSLFLGYFESGSKHGYGEFFWSDRSCYKGEFFNGFIHGHGCYMWDDGRSYTGQWQFNAMHGNGKFIWPDGTQFIGRFENDKKLEEGNLITSKQGKVHLNTEEKIVHNLSFIS
jgi:hypothetical protein